VKRAYTHTHTHTHKHTHTRARAQGAPGQIEQLDLGALVLDDAGHGRERGELVRCDLGVHASKICEQRRLADGRKALPR
jgi:hypothetical protein